MVNFAKNVVKIYHDFIGTVPSIKLLDNTLKRSLDDRQPVPHSHRDARVMTGSLVSATDHHVIASEDFVMIGNSRPIFMNEK